MTKAKKVNYVLSDFFTKDISEKATKMKLMYDDKDTGCFLMVKGIDAKSIQRARIIAQVSYAEAAEKSELIKDKIDKTEFERAQKERIEINLALTLLDSWSFDDFSPENTEKLFKQNQGLAFAVIAHATTPGNYLVKK